ncbi:MAG: ABC transporter ATP-binding protein [Chitinophagaceae bacterium]|nr:ABC transporter ATP-binding protein [Oligoflexus sp.]
MLKVKGLTHAPRGSVAIQDFNLTVGDGEKIAIIGLHNSGKSMLLQILAGYILPHQGRIKIRGSDLRYDAQEARRHFGYVPSHPTLDGEWKVEETFRLFATMRDMPFPTNTAEDLAEKWLLKKELSHSIHELHYGQKMRVLMALATLHDPELLFLDDPLQGLDPKELHSIIDILGRKFNRSSIILATNKIESLPAWIDRILVLDNGVIKIDMKFEGTEPLMQTLVELWKEPRGNDKESLDSLSS